MPIVYPVTGTVPSTTTHSSNGSYGAVFIVLAVIVTISGFACFLGRMLNKRQNEERPSRPKEKDTKRNSNGFQTKDGDIEFGYDKRLASAKVSTTNVPTMARPNSFGDQKIARPSSFHEPNVGRGDSFREPTMGQANMFHKSNKVQPSSFDEPTMGRPSSFQEPSMGRPNSFQEPSMGRPSSFQEPTMGRPNSFQEPSMGRPISYQEPTMGQSNTFHEGQSQGDQARFGADNRDNGVNFKIRTRAQRY
ncbi:hypothetical protein Tco_0951201 [Tanacetum coccineum]|uniref:Uncharacterized protein n=1 Tax=Tanacetum coccineum TaxID=301880 RepID=A0ABQ5DTF1_9ASTR